MHEITGATKLLAVIGHPVAHSLSPKIHNRFAADLKLHYTYMAFDIEPQGLEEFLDAARLLGMAGFNLTMPLKERVLPYLDVLDDAAKEYGAVNTVAVRDGRLYGYNTDGGGFVLSLENRDFDFARGAALVLGTGGAAKAVAIALSQNGMKVKMASRRAESLMPLRANIEYCCWADISSEAVGCDLVVNATPLGMHGMQDGFANFSFLDVLEKDHIVYDLVYTPAETELLKQAKNRGLRTISGLHHLLHQAALSFWHFTGIMPLPESIAAITAEFEAIT